MGHRTFSSNISRFDYLINRVQKKVGKNNSKRKKKKNKTIVKDKCFRFQN